MRIRGGRDGLLEQTAERPIAWAVHDGLERVVPEDHAAEDVYDAHSLAERRNHLATTAIVGGSTEVVVICTKQEHEREGDGRQHVPRAALEHLDESNSDGGADDVARTGAEQRLRPCSIDGLLREHRQQELGRGACHDAVREQRDGDRGCMPGPSERVQRAAECLVDQCRDQRRDDRRDVRDHLGDRIGEQPLRARGCRRARQGHDSRGVAAESQQYRKHKDKRRRHRRADPGG